MLEKEYSVAWSPQSGPQTAALLCPAFDLLYGGARGGGKTDFLIGDWAAHAEEYGSVAKGIIIRKTYPQLEEVIYRGKEVYGKLGAEWRAADKKWLFPNGAQLSAKHMEYDSDAENIQGFGVTWLAVDEIGNFSNPAPLDQLKASIRSAKGVKVKFRATANPGGVGHSWLKQRYIDPAPLGYEFLDDGSGNTRIFIPSRVHDNKILMENDPTYVSRLRASGPPELVKAWLDGDWNVIQGAYFPEFSIDKHVVAPHAIPQHWLKFVAFDWGYSSPFAVGWFTVCDGEEYGYPKGAIIQYREWYGGSLGKGIRMQNEDVAHGILRMEKERIHYRVADPSIFKEDGGESIAEKFARKGVMFRRADNKRISGWSNLRSRLVGTDGVPSLYFFSTCVNSIRTIPTMQHSIRDPEDLETESDDHMLDCIRYGINSRPYVKKDESKNELRLYNFKDLTFNQIHALDENNRARSKFNPKRI